ncbi:hypothetical protein GCM10025865_05510 [Paraoerskovia sediminicola]|uniref:Protein ImuA n=1 Tax=Paraoerskovia sediminicola TaxID=1138587 RepID=A0ABM8FZT7_9CELL|nr:hypothetical protein [Paraoerskovia sediminicola]BDZ41252.1 hypothetical protein GCM10025865_05510 [Paraoerskovia sediminicola]
MLRADPGARCYLVGGARSPLRQALPWAGTASSDDEVVALAENLALAMADDDTEGRIVVVVESLSERLQSPADKPLVALMKAAKASDHLVIAESETSGWGSTWPLLAEMKAGRRGLLLQPGAMDGDTIFKTSLPRTQASEFPPGRGMWVARGRFVRVQVPLVIE